MVLQPIEFVTLVEAPLMTAVSESVPADQEVGIESGHAAKAEQVSAHRKIALKIASLAIGCFIFITS